MSEVSTAVEGAVDTATRNVTDAVAANATAPIKADTTAALVTKPIAAKSAPLAVKAAAKPRIARIKTPATAVVEAVRKVNRKASATVAKRKYVRKVASPINAAAVKPLAAPTSNTYFQGTKTMTDATNFFAGFTQLPGADKFQTLFADAGEKSQEAVRKSQAFAEQLTEAAKANLEAVVEASRIATAGARDLGTEIVATTKSSVEQTTAAVKTLTEAKSPTEFFQLQSEMVRASFDRMVADGSKFTKQMVKLAGEAVQPLSSRASVNAEKFSELTAA